MQMQGWMGEGEEGGRVGVGEELAIAGIGEGEEGRGIEREMLKSGSTRGVDGVSAVTVVRGARDVVDGVGVPRASMKSPNRTALPPGGSSALDAAVP